MDMWIVEVFGMHAGTNVNMLVGNASINVQEYLNLERQYGNMEVCVLGNAIIIMCEYLDLECKYGKRGVWCR